MSVSCTNEECADLIERARRARDHEHARAEDYRDALIVAERRIAELERLLGQCSFELFAGDVRRRCVHAPGHAGPCVFR